MNSNEETELKLRLARAALPAALKALTRISGTPARKNHLMAVYYDTARLRLTKSGYALRVRAEGRDFIQTLKREATGDALVRDEWSKPVAMQKPDLTGGAAARKIRRIISSDPLRAMFRVNITRHIFELGGKSGAEIEASIDTGEIKTPDGRREPVTEIELELKSGNPIALYRAALEISRRVEISLEPRSKSARGFAFHGHRLSIARLDPPVFTLDEALGTALQRTGRRYFAQYVANIPLMLEGEPDAAHAMRVAVRRLRSAVSAAKPFLPDGAADKWNARLRKIQRALGELRDLDVLTSQVSGGQKQRSKQDKGRGQLSAWMGKRRQAALAKARKTVLSPSQTRAWLGIMEWFEQLGGAVRPTARLATPLRLAVPAIFDRLMKRARKRGRKADEQSPTQLHRLRIACKKLRYGLELFGSPYPARQVSGVLAPVKGLQNSLGALNDAVVARSYLLAVSGKQAHARDTKASLSRMDRRSEAAMADAVRQLERLRKAEKFWRRSK
ncbi:MAG: CHAD domain-containing protein [Rhodospirillaceae bacterium]|nr:CHAD domain-containing protein [Rhodospirillaceae bacterium]